MTDIRKFFGGGVGGGSGGGSGGGGGSGSNRSGTEPKPSKVSARRPSSAASTKKSSAPSQKRRKTASTTSAYFDLGDNDDDDDDGDDDEFVLPQKRSSSTTSKAPRRSAAVADDDGDDFVPNKKERRKRLLIDDEDAMVNDDDDDGADDEEVGVEYDDEERVRPRKRSKLANGKSKQSAKTTPPIPTPTPILPPPPPPPLPSSDVSSKVAGKSASRIVDESSVWAMSTSDTPSSRLPQSASAQTISQKKFVPIKPEDFFADKAPTNTRQSDGDLALRIHDEETAQRKRTEDASYALALKLQAEENAKKHAAAVQTVDDDTDDVQFVSTKTSTKTPTKASTSSAKKSSKTPPKQKTSPPAPAPQSDVNGEFDPYDSSDKKKGRPAWMMAKSRPPPKLEGLKAVPQGAPGCLKGLTFVLSGVLESLDRDAAKDLVVKYGGKVTTGISGKTDYLVLGDDGGESKRAKAKEKGTKVIDENGLFALISSQPAQSTAPQIAPSKAGNKETAAMRAAKSVVTHVDPASAASRQLLTVHGQTAASASDMLWVDKHRPMKMSDIVGNETIMQRIKLWLTTFQGNMNNAKFQRAILISGAPGSGKSSAASIISRACGFEPIEFNASDARNRGTIETVIGNVAGIHSIGEYFSSNNADASKKAVIIMDEVDGMGGNEDRGGMQSLINVIKKTKTPIVCICNDASSIKIRSLKNYCVQHVWRRPTLTQIEPRIAAIAHSEGLSIDSPTIAKLVEATQADIRQIINFLQMFRKTHRAITYDQAKNTLASATKDFDQNTFSVVPSLFRSVDRHATNWINERINLYFLDAGLMPLFVEDQFLNGRPTIDPAGAAPSVQSLQIFSAAADLISDGDVLSAAFRSDSVDFSYMPEHAVISTVAPAYLVGPISGANITFPTWMAQNSKRTKNSRLLREIGQAISIDVNGAHGASLILDYLPLIRYKIIEPIREDQSAAVVAVIDSLDEFGLTREDIPVIVELTDAVKPESERAADKAHFTGAINSALTREYKKGTHIRKVTRTGAEKDAGVSRGGTAVRIALDGLEEEDEDVVEEETADGDGDGDGDGADDIKKDKLIVGTSTSTGAKTRGVTGGSRGGSRYIHSWTRRRKSRNQDFNEGAAQDTNSRPRTGRGRYTRRQNSGAKTKTQRR